MDANVGLIRGDDRYTNVTQALEQVADQIVFEGRRQVLVKPNLVGRRQLSATHFDALRAVLDFVRARYAGPVLLAEGAAMENTWESFAHFGYEKLVESHKVTLVDLNADETVAVQVYDRHLRPLRLRLARTAVESDLRISVGPPKTHDAVIVTLSIKNMVMGCLVNASVAERAPTPEAPPRPTLLGVLASLTPRWVRNTALSQWAMTRMAANSPSDKFAMHQSYPVINLNLALIAPWVWPHVAVVDGFEAMEGDGPNAGDPVDWQIALAGTDALAVDTLTAHLMGFDPAEVGYLDYCKRLNLGVAAPERIGVTGNVTVEAARRQFQPHPTYRQQRRWLLADVDRLLQRASQV
ncbi:MAG TPA: DUF362 domain-containing protein [Anaerolineae bacterium]|nr:DUF362 domain-containing protein [Anaerolineae bacterium]